MFDFHRATKSRPSVFAASTTKVSGGFSKADAKNRRAALIRSAHTAIDTQPQDQVTSKDAAQEALWAFLDEDGLRALVEFEPWVKNMLLRAVINEALRERHDVTKVVYGPDQKPRFSRPKGGGAQEANETQSWIGAASKNGDAGKDQKIYGSHEPSVQPASPTATQVAANKEVARAVSHNWLRSLMVNGQRLANVTKRELLDSAKADATNSRFKSLIASCLPTDETKVGDCMTNEDIDKIMTAAKEPTDG